MGGLVCPAVQNSPDDSPGNQGPFGFQVTGLRLLGTTVTSLVTSSSSGKWQDTVPLLPAGELPTSGQDLTVPARARALSGHRGCTQVSSLGSLTRGHCCPGYVASSEASCIGLNSDLE